MTRNNGVAQVTQAVIWAARPQQASYISPTSVAASGARELRYHRHGRRRQLASSHFALFSPGGGNFSVRLSIHDLQVNWTLSELDTFSIFSRANRIESPTGPVGAKLLSDLDIDNSAQYPEQYGDPKRFRRAATVRRKSFCRRTLGDRSNFDVFFSRRKRTNAGQGKCRLHRPQSGPAASGWPVEVLGARRGRRSYFLFFVCFLSWSKSAGI